MSHTASKMGILSHRGLWRAPEEKNTTAAFLRSFELGFGTETDIRDCDGKLVISHDPPEARAEPLPLHVFLDLYDRHGNGLPLALNIKADGLQSRVCDHITAYGIRNYFCFDMSVPDTRGYPRAGVSSASRARANTSPTRRSTPAPPGCGWTRSSAIGSASATSSAT